MIGVAEFWLSWLKPQIEERPFQFKIDPPPGTEFLLENGGGNVISPDGRTVAFVAASAAGSKLWTDRWTRLLRGNYPARTTLSTLSGLLIPDRLDFSLMASFSGSTLQAALL